jgi:phenylpyruvate tautomerase PptA (4-oxalocrotonate tautomerase family)
MPYLHLDLPLAVPAADRAQIAVRLAQLYADVMEADPRRVAVAFREVGENGVVRTGADGAVEPIVVVQCDIRRGRPPEQRKRLGTAIAAMLDEALGWPPAQTVIEFTEHAGDEFWRDGTLGRDWSPAEAGDRR